MYFVVPDLQTGQPRAAPELAAMSTPPEFAQPPAIAAPPEPAISRKPGKYLYPGRALPAMAPKPVDEGMHFLF